MHTPEFQAFLARLAPRLPVPAPRAPAKPQSDAQRIALLKIALDQLLLTPGVRRVAGRDLFEFAQSVREGC